MQQESNMTRTSALPTERLWIVGGEYVDTRFEQMIEHTRQVLGPFADYDQARSRWREIAEATRSSCTARFGIAREALAGA